MDQVYFYADDGDIILGIKDLRGGGGVIVLVVDV